MATLAVVVVALVLLGMLAVRRQSGPSRLRKSSPRRQASTARGANDEERGHPNVPVPEQATVAPKRSPEIQPEAIAPSKGTPASKAQPHECIANGGTQTTMTLPEAANSPSSPIDINEKAADREGYTPLHVAARMGDVVIMQKLLLTGADVASRESRGKTALHVAAEYGHVEIVELLLRNGAEVNAYRHSFWTPLMLALEKGHRAVAEVLLRAGATPGAMGDQFVHDCWLIAARRGDQASLKLLTAYGGDVNVVDSQRLTALHKAADEGHALAVESLIAAGSDVTAQNHRGWTPLMFAALSNKRDAPTILDRLLAAGADPNSRDTDGSTPLHGSAAKGHVEVVRRLLKAGADPRAINRAGTPLDLAKAYHHFEVVMVLQSLPETPGMA